MRFRALALAVAFAFATAGWMRHAAAQGERDFVFKDEDGHLVLRFAGADASKLDADEVDEIVNLQLSTMVHDRLRADARFDAEPVDASWAHPMEKRIEQRVGEATPELVAVHAECRSASCRIVLEHAGGRTVAEHQSLMDAVQRSVGAFIDAEPAGFTPVFLIAAHYQDPAAPYLKVFLRRKVEPPRPREPSGG